MEHEVTVIMLAGTMRSSPLRADLEVPVLCLPLAGEGRENMGERVLDRWLAALATIRNLGEIRIVVNDEEDRTEVDAVLESRVGGTKKERRIRTEVEPAAWRGVGGIIRDTSVDLPKESLVVVVEAHTLPPLDLSRLVTPMLGESGQMNGGVVGVAGDAEPAGVFVFRRQWMEEIPAVGYYDLKEQFLPAIRKKGADIGLACITDQVIRLRDRQGYLQAVEESAKGKAMGMKSGRVSKRAIISDSAMLDGVCVVEDGVTIGDGAVIHESVVMRGVKIGGGAVVSKSVVGPLAQIEARERIIRRVVGVGAREIYDDERARRRGMMGTS